MTQCDGDYYLCLPHQDILEVMSFFAFDAVLAIFQVKYASRCGESFHVHWVSSK